MTVKWLSYQDDPEIYMLSIVYGIHQSYLTSFFLLQRGQFKLFNFLTSG